MLVVTEPEYLADSKGLVARARADGRDLRVQAANGGSLTLCLSQPERPSLADASRRLVDELSRYQRAGRGTPLPSEVVAAVEDVQAALEVGGE